MRLTHCRRTTQRECPHPAHVSAHQRHLLSASPTCVVTQNAQCRQHRDTEQRLPETRARAKASRSPSPAGEGKKRGGSLGQLLLPPLLPLPLPLGRPTRRRSRPTDLGGDDVMPGLRELVPVSPAPSSSSSPAPPPLSPSPTSSSHPSSAA